MAKQHLKRIAAPKTWKIKRKSHIWISRPNAGAHSLKQSVSLNTAMKEIIKCAMTSSEVKIILNTKTVLVDGKRRKEPKFPVGLMDVLSLPDIKRSYRMLISKKGTIYAANVKSGEELLKPCKIIGKTSLDNKRVQLNLGDSRSIVLKKETTPYKVGDSILLELPKQEIKEHLKLEKGAVILLTGGKHVGETATLESIKENIIACTTGTGSFETAKRYAFVIGKGTPAIAL